MSALLSSGLPADARLRIPGGYAASAAKYRAIFAINLRHHLAYLGEMFLRIIFLSFILYIFLQLWHATYAAEGSETIAGFGVEQMIWYLALTESIVLSRPALNTTIDAEIRSGDIAYTLVRPYGYAGYHLASYLAERCLRFVITLAAACAVALLYVGPVAISPVDVALALVATGLAMAIDFLASFGIALLAFWIENTSSLELIYSRLAMLLGGMLLPLELFPEPLATIAAVLPFSAIVHGPARLALGAASGDFWPLLAKQLLFLLAGGLVAGALYRAALRRLTLNGG